MTTLAGLQSWLQQQCDGEWEHTYGVTIRSTDNPGWWVTVDLRGTALENKPFAPLVQGDFTSGNPEPPWVHCRVKDSVFHGAGDAQQLDTILATFLAWARPG